MDKRFLQRSGWYLFSIVSFFAYYSGILLLKKLFRKHIFKRCHLKIINYHRICDNPDGLKDIFVSIRHFDKQINYLKKYYKIVPLEELVKYIKGEEKINVDIATITFDDGYLDNYTNAFPILKKYNIPATIFLTTGFMETNKLFWWDKHQDNVNNSCRRTLKWEEIREMYSEGIYFGSHTVNHSDLIKLNMAEIEKELSQSKKEIENVLGVKIVAFSYPYGKKRNINLTIIEILKKVGYKYACSIINGNNRINDDIYMLKRNGMRNFPLFVFISRLELF